MNLPDDLKKALRQRFVSDFTWATRTVLGYGFFDAPMHDQIGAFASKVFDAKEKFSVLLAPRGHGKSKQVTAGLPVWLLCRNPNLKILIIHGSAGLAESIMSEAVEQFEQNELLRALFPDVVWKTRKDAPKWKADEIILKRKIIDHTPSLAATSMSSAKTGRHFDLIICDDLVNAENTTTPEQIDKVKTFVKTLSPLLMGPKSRILLVGTRWHYEDCYGWLMGSNEMQKITRSLVLTPFNEDGSPAWPSKHTPESLDAEKAAMGPYLFSANYLNNPSPDGTMLFNEERINRFVPEYDAQGRIKIPERADGPRSVYYFTGTDPNAGIDQQHDLGVVMTVGRDDEGNFWLVDVNGGHPTVDEMIAWIRKHVQLWNPMSLLVETVAYQRQLAHWIRKDAMSNGLVYPIREIGSAERGRTQKYTRIRALDPLINAGKLWVPYGSRFDDVVKQIALYSSAARHDDYVDTLADIWQYGTNPPPRKKPQPPGNPYTIAAFTDRILNETKRRGIARVETTTRYR